jgi:hypothetical protein
MHPDLIQTIAAQQSRSLLRDAAAYRHAERIRRSQRTRRPRAFTRLARTGSGLRPRVA